jgi:hypothetical protein
MDNESSAVMDNESRGRGRARPPSDFDVSSRSGSAVLVEIPVQRGPAHPQVLGDVPAGVTVGLHPVSGGEVLGVVDLAGTPELGAVGTRSCGLERRPLLAG